MAQEHNHKDNKRTAEKHQRGDMPPHVPHSVGPCCFVSANIPLDAARAFAWITCSHHGMRHPSSLASLCRKLPQQQHLHLKRTRTLHSSSRSLGMMCEPTSFSALQFVLEFACLLLPSHLHVSSVRLEHSEMARADLNASQWNCCQHWCHADP